jgi:peptide deformylase
VDRCEKVKVTARRPDGEETAIEAEGLLSIVLQHEIDHLDGKLIIDRLSSLRRDRYYTRRIRGKS